MYRKCKSCVEKMNAIETLTAVIQNLVILLDELKKPDGIDFEKLKGIETKILSYRIKRGKA